MPEQSFKKHAAVDPLHMALLLVFLLNVIFTFDSLCGMVRAYYELHGVFGTPAIGVGAVLKFLFGFILAVALFVLAAKTRSNALKVQDRVIRLEERIRFATILPQPLLAQSAALTAAQYIGLRFASDAELPALVQRTLAENLSRKEIKAAIVEWRADHFRL